MQRDLKEALANELKPIREEMKKLYNEYMRKSATVSGADKTFGLRDKDGRFYIGNKEAKIKENNIIVGNKEYTGTPGLWELIVARSPDDKICTNEDYDNYAEIMHSKTPYGETMTNVKLNRKPTKAGNGNRY